MSEHIKRRVAEIEGWYSIERNRQLDILDQEKAKRLKQIRKICTHDMSPWVKHETQMVCGFATEFRSTCNICGQECTSDTLPAGLDYTPIELVHVSYSALKGRSLHAGLVGVVPSQQSVHQGRWRGPGLNSVAAQSVLFEQCFYSRLSPNAGTSRISGT
jgi:hypothetical protein